MITEAPFESHRKLTEWATAAGGLEAELQSWLRCATLGNDGVPPMRTPQRPDGRHVLRSMICSTRGVRLHCDGVLPRSKVRMLHNELGLDAAAYPVRGLRGSFFSEALDDANPEAGDYFDLVKRSMSVLAAGSQGRSMTLGDLIDRGRRIQQLDEHFANSRAEAPLDALHQCMGPDPVHPYAKITLCRTTFPIAFGDKEIMFFFEKFLVSYSYLDASGRRCPTTTPIHSHPLNFETAYFRSFGPSSRVAEQEFRLFNGSGVALIDDKGEVDERFFEDHTDGPKSAIRVVAGAAHDIVPSRMAIPLEPFDMELALRGRSGLITAADGLFRPHQVTVLDDPNTATRYFALDNYFGPIGRVLVYGQNGARIRSLDDWDKRRCSSTGV